MAVLINFMSRISRFITEARDIHHGIGLASAEIAERTLRLSAYLVAKDICLYL